MLLMGVGAATGGRVGITETAAPVAGPSMAMPSPFPPPLSSHWTRRIPAVSKNAVLCTWSTARRRTSATPCSLCLGAARGAYRGAAGAAWQGVRRKLRVEGGPLGLSGGAEGAGGLGRETDQP